MRMQNNEHKVNMGISFYQLNLSHDMNPTQRRHPDSSVNCYLNFVELLIGCPCQAGINPFLWLAHFLGLFNLNFIYTMDNTLLTLGYMPESSLVHQKFWENQNRPFEAAIPMHQPEKQNRDQTFRNSPLVASFRAFVSAVWLAPPRPTPPIGTSYWLAILFHFCSIAVLVSPISEA